MINSIDIEKLQKLARERTVKTQTVEYDLETIVKKIDKGIIKLDPEYQRKYRWTDGVSSRLIESLILNIPIPIIYISQDVDVDAETDEARYSVIDGQQRLTAIYKFMNSQYKLIDMSILTVLNGYSYDDLPPFLVRRLEERTIKCLRIDSTVDPQVKYDIFERLNSGSVKLTNQELRNAVYRGEFNETLKELSKYPEFRKLVRIDNTDPDKNEKVKKMEDVELVLRFISLDEGRYQAYAPIMKKFLDNSMGDFSNKSVDLVHIRNRFISVIKYISSELGDIPFAKYREDGTIASKFNTAVYDAVSIGIANSKPYSLSKPLTSRQTQKLKHLIVSEDFILTVSGSTNDREPLIRRIEMVKEVLN